MSLFRGRGLFWLAAILICVLDLGTKAWVFRVLNVDPGSFETIEEFRRSSPRRLSLVGDSVSLVALFNPGMMWGKFADYSQVLIFLRTAAVLVIWYLLRGIEPRQWGSHLALGGILGGAIGNIYDSLKYIGVRDFLEVDLDFFMFDPFPAFNVADSAICVGVALLALGLLRGEPAAKSEAAA